MTGQVLSIGDRLRNLRTERALTQEALSERSGVSVDLIKKLEQGKRETARLTSLVALANALDVPLSQLMDKRPRLDGGNDRLVLGLRDALLSPDLLPGFDPADDGGEPTPLTALRGAVSRAWGDYWAGRFIDLARTLPGLIAEARVTRRTNGPPATGPLAQAYQITACLLVHLGREDLAALAAERGLAAAATGDDELQWATLNGAYSWALLSQARYEQAEQLAIRTAERIEPRFSSATEQHLTVWGGLVLWAMAAAVEGGRGDAAIDHLTLSRVGSARMTKDRHDYGVNFGPTQVAMQGTYAYAVLGEPDKALTAARDVHREDLFAISYGRHLLDVAQAHADARRDSVAVDVLQEAKNIAPTWFRHQIPARTLVTELRERKARLSPSLRDLVQSLGPA